MDLLKYIKVYDNVIPEEVCKKIIQDYEDRSHLVETHDTDGYKFHQLNLNKTDLAPLAQAFAGTLIPLYEQYFKELGVLDFVTVDNFEEVRIKKYLKGTDDQFKTHVDVMNHDTASRFCIAILYLNDNDGLTVFNQLGIGVEPKAGRVVIFPPFWMFPHAGLSPTNDDKYIIMTSLRYV
jgi:hypothetical protein